MKEFILMMIGSVIGITAMCYTHQCPQPPFQSVIDKQQELADLGYDIVVDGKLGPETQQAWNAEWDKRNFSNEVFE